MSSSELPIKHDSLSGLIEVGLILNDRGCMVVCDRWLGWPNGMFLSVASGVTFGQSRLGLWAGLSIRFLSTLGCRKTLAKSRICQCCPKFYAKLLLTPVLLETFNLAVRISKLRSCQRTLDKLMARKVLSKI